MITSLEIEKMKRTKKNFKALYAVLNDIEIAYDNYIHELKLSYIIAVTKSYIKKACKAWSEVCYSEGKIILDLEKGTLYKEDIPKYNGYAVNFGTFPDSGVSVTNCLDLHFVEINVFIFVACILRACEAETLSEIENLSLSEAEDLTMAEAKAISEAEGKKSIEAYIEKLVSHDSTHDSIHDSKHDSTRYSFRRAHAARPLFVYKKPIVRKPPYKAQSVKRSYTQAERICLSAFGFLYRKTRSPQYQTLIQDLLKKEDFNSLAFDCLQECELALFANKDKNEEEKVKTARNAIFKAIRAELPYKGRKTIISAESIPEAPLVIKHSDGTIEEYTSGDKITYNVKSAYAIEFITINGNVNTDMEEVPILDKLASKEADVDSGLLYMDLLEEIANIINNKVRFSIFCKHYIEGYSPSILSEIYKIPQRTLYYRLKADRALVMEKFGSSDLWRYMLNI